MAIVTELYEINGRSFTKTYSDSHRYVVREGISYSEANDPTEFGRTYTEGDLIEEEASNDELVQENREMKEILNVLLGDES